MDIRQEIQNNSKNDSSEELEKFTNKFIKKMTYDLENFHYNVLIASNHQMHSFLTKEIKKGFTKETLIKNYKKILISINPVLPHFSSECLEMFENKEEIKWPTYEEKFLETDMTTIVIQINGKKRGLHNTKKDLEESDLLKEIKTNMKFAKILNNVNIKKKIYIKNKIINFII